MKVGDYALVVKVPEPWESSGESEEDRESYMGHVGIVIESVKEGAMYDDEMVLLRFPTLNDKSNEIGQRNIERSALRFVSQPAHELPRICVES